MKNKKLFLALFSAAILFVCFFVIAPLSQAEELMTSDEAERVGARHYYHDDGGHSVHGYADLMIRHKKGQIRHHYHIRCREEFYGKNDVEFKQYIYLFRPPDLERLQILLVTYVPWLRKEKDIWMYLPELRKIRRVPQADGDDAFMGTDIIWDGLPRERPSWRDTCAHERDEVYEGRPVQVLKATVKIGKGFDKKTYRYPVRLCFIDKETLISYKEDYFDRKGRLAITRKRPWFVNKFGYWRPTVYFAENHFTGSNSMTDVGARWYDCKEPDEYFSPGLLGKLRSIPSFRADINQLGKEGWDLQNREFVLKEHVLETPLFPDWYKGEGYNKTHTMWEWEWE